MLFDIQVSCYDGKSSYILAVSLCARAAEEVILSFSKQQDLMLIKNKAWHHLKLWLFMINYIKRPDQ